MDAPKKKGRKKKEAVSKKTAQKRNQRARTTMSQSVKQSVVVNVGTTKRKSTPKKGGMPSSYQHNLAPTFIQSPQVDYTPLILALNRTPNPIQPMATISERTPLSVQIAEQELASSSTFEPIPLEMNRRPRSSFISKSHLDRRVEADEPRAEVDFGFGNQQFIPRPRTESGISELSEDSMGGFTPLTNPRFTPKAPRKSESITSDERSILDDDLPSFYLSSIDDIKSNLTSTSSESSIQSSMSSIQQPTRKPTLQDELPVQEQPHSSIGSLSSSVKTSSSLASSFVTGSLKTVEPEGSIASSKKVRLGRPLVQSGSSVGSREQPNFEKFPVRSTAIYKALNTTFDNYDKQNRLKDLKPNEVGRILGNIANKRRVDKLYKAKVITYDELTGYYERQNIKTKPPIRPTT